MWAVRSRSFFSALVLLLLVFSISIQASSEDKKIWLWQSELDELTMLINELEISNESKQALLNEALKTSESLSISLKEALELVANLRLDSAQLTKLSQMIEQASNEREIYWKEYEREAKAEIAQIRLEKNLWTAGTVAATVLAVLAFLWGLTR